MLLNVETHVNNFISININRARKIYFHVSELHVVRQMDADAQISTTRRVSHMKRIDATAAELEIQT
jgi:hypothetical protein